MLPSSRELILNSPVSRMSLLGDDRLAVFTDDMKMIFIDLGNLNIEKSITLGHDKKEKFNFYNRPFALKKGLAYVKLSKEGKEYILDIKEKIQKTAVFDHNNNETVTKAYFSEDLKYLVIGNETGKTYVIDTNSGELVYKFPNLKDSISSVAFSPDNRYIVSVSFDKSINILDLGSFSLNSGISADDITEKIQFIDNETFIAITRNGKILKIDAKNKTILKENKFSQNVWPSDICISNSKKFLYIGTRESILFALHTGTLEIVYSMYLKRSGITALVRAKKYFIIGFQTGEIRFFNHRENEEQFIQNVKLRKIQDAALLFDKNIFLMSHYATKDIYNIWSESIETITLLMANGDILEAKKMASGFMFHPKCKMEMSVIDKIQPDLVLLKKYIRTGSFDLAYEVADNNPLLRSTVLYNKLEDIWRSSFKRSMALLSKDPVMNRERAKSEISRFSNVRSKKEIISMMMHNSHIFTKAQKAVKSQDFDLYFDIVEKNDFLKLTPLYKNILVLAEKIHLNIKELIKQKDYTNALKNTELLQKFRPFQIEAKDHEIRINNLMQTENKI